MIAKDFLRQRIRMYRQDPLLFFKEVTHFQPDPWQEKAARIIAKDRRLAVRSGQGVGKTAFEANMVLWFLVCFPYPRVVCTAPTRQQLNDVLWAEIAKWMERSPIIGLILHWTKTRVYMKGYEKRWFAVARTATKPENMQGFHEDNMLFIVDEASGVADPILEAIAGTLTGPNNKLLYCGNPTKATGNFADAFGRDADSWKTMTVSSRNSPRTNKENIAALEKKYGVNSNVVRVRVDGLPPRAEDDVFIPISIAEQAVMTEPVDHIRPTRIAIGIDIARFGNDDTVIAENIDRDIQPLITRHGQDLYATADDIIARYNVLRNRFPKYRGVIYAIVDDTGVGGGVTDILNREKAVQGLTRLVVVPVNFSSAVPDKEAAKRYADIATWMWGCIRDLAMAGELHLPNDDGLIGQLSTRKYGFSGSPEKLKLESKDSLKKRGLPSPDRADAVALSLYEGDVFDIKNLIR